MRFCLRRVSQCRERLRHQNELSEHHKKLLRRFASVQRIQSDVTPKQNSVSKRRRYGGVLRHCSKQRRYWRGAAATRRGVAVQEAGATKGHFCQVAFWGFLVGDSARTVRRPSSF